MSDVTSFPRYVTAVGERRGVFVYRVRTYVMCSVLCELIPSVHLW